MVRCLCFTACFFWTRSWITLLRYPNKIASELSVICHLCFKNFTLKHFLFSKGCPCLLLDLVWEAALAVYSVQLVERSRPSTFYKGTKDQCSNWPEMSLSCTQCGCPCMERLVWYSARACSSYLHSQTEVIPLHPSLAILALHHSSGIVVPTKREENHLSSAHTLVVAKAST